MTHSEKTFEFHGTAGEWFGIWIVNLLLSIITIGIYSAWAKVRRLKYFYNNTLFEGRNFDYHATGKQIFIGRLIFIAGYAVFVLLLSLSPTVGLIGAILFLVALPWFLIRGIRFNARMTSFSNVRFNFEGKYWGAVYAYVLLPIGVYIAFAALMVAAVYLGQSAGFAVSTIVGLLALAIIPVGGAFAHRAIICFTANNYFLGNAAFDIRIALRPFLIGQAEAVGWLLMVGLIGAVVLGFEFRQVMASLAALDGGYVGPGDVRFIVLFYVMIFAAFIPAAFIYQAMVRNAVYAHTALEGGHRLRSDINPFTYFWIALSNLVVVVCTLGLMLPWAQIRLMRYLARHTHATPGTSLDTFVGEQTAAGHAVGDAFADFEGMDVGLPV